MSVKWEYQRDTNRIYRKWWNDIHRSEQTAYRREYRRKHPEATREQWKRDTRRYRLRLDPAALKERQRIYDARYHAKLKAIKQALMKKGDSDYAGSSEEGNC